MTRQHAGHPLYAKRVKRIKPDKLIGYWALNDENTATAFDQSNQGNNGTYSAVTLAAAADPYGRKCPLFVPASESVINVYSAGLAADFSTTAGTIAIWVKVSGAGVWTDTTTRIIYQFQTNNGTDVFAGFYKVDTAGVVYIDFAFRLNNVWEDVVINTTTTDWFHIALTWNTVADEMKAYFNGAQTGSTQTGLGSHAGPITQASIGNATSTGSPWNGYLAHAAIWNTPLSASEIELLAKLHS